MRKQLYLDIKNHLKGIVKNENGEIIYLKGLIETDENYRVMAVNGVAVEENLFCLFRHYDLWNRQVEFIEQETPFTCPAIFIEFPPITWKTLGERMQDCTLTVRLHIVTQWFSQTADYSPTEVQALQFLDIIDKVFYHLQGFSTSYMNRWMRTQSITNHNHERYVDNEEEYICNLRDTSAMLEYTPVQVTPEIKKEAD